MSSFTESLFARLLRCLAQAICRHPKWFVYPQILLFVLSVFYTVHGLKLDMSRDNLVGAKKKYHQNYLKYRQEFPGQDELVVVVESGSMERNRQFVERLSAKLEKETNLFTDVFFKGDIPALGSKALLLVPEKDLEELRKTLKDFSPFIQEFTKATNLNSLFTLINRQFLAAGRQQDEKTDSLVKAIPALHRIIAQARDCLSRSGIAPSPGLYALFDGGVEAEQQIYITFDQGRIYLATAKARSAELSDAAIQRIRELVGETQFEVPGLNVGLTGEPVLEYDEMKQSEHDSILASIASLLICSFIFIYAYRQTGRPLKAIACLIIGLGYTMGFTTLAIGHLNILTITFAPILIGLAIDFGIHYITRYEEEMRHGRTVEEAVDKAIVCTGQGIVTGALTTAAAFLAMGLTDFKGIQEMGIISGGGLVLCLIPMMTLLPVLMMTGRQNQIDHEQGAALEKRVQIENLWLERPGMVSLITLALCVVSGLQLSKVYFDYDLLHMQSQGLPAVVFEEKLIHSGTKSVIFAAVIADDAQQARGLVEKIKELKDKTNATVGSIESMAEYLTEDQTRKLELVRKIKLEVEKIHFTQPVDVSPPATTSVSEAVIPASVLRKPAEIEDLSATLYSFMGFLGQGVEAAQQDEPKIAEQLAALREEVVRFRVAVLNGDPTIHERLFNYQAALFKDLRDTFAALREQDAGGPLRGEDLPPAIRNRFVGVTGKQLIQVYPKKDIWDHDNQREFLRDLRVAVGDENRVTGTPVQLYEYTTLLKNSYQEAALYSLAAIALMVLLHFRSISCVILALLPVAIGTIWMLGFMGMAGVPFNPANIMTLPLVIGIGVTNGIHILNRFAEEQKPGVLAKSTGKAVLVSGLTAITGFGTLLLAKHQGIQSLGEVMSVGIATCMIAGLTFLPALLSILTRHGWTLKMKK